MVRTNFIENLPRHPVSAPLGQILLKTSGWIAVSRKATRHHVRSRVGCSLLRSLRTRARSRNTMHENSRDPKGPKLAASLFRPPIVVDPPSETFLRAFAWPQLRASRKFRQFACEFRRSTRDA